MLNSVQRGQVLWRASVNDGADPASGYGEIYNFVELRNSLVAKGVNGINTIGPQFSIRSKSDIENP